MKKIADVSIEGWKAMMLGSWKAANFYLPKPPSFPAFKPF
jgi:hypothetical protein